MQRLAILIASAIPLAMAPGLVSAFDITPKLAILLFCDSVLLLGCKQFVNGASVLVHSTAGRLYTACIAALWLSTLASSLGSSDVVLSLNGSSWRREGFVAESAILLFAWFAAAWFAEDRGNLRILLRAAVIMGAAGSLYGIAQYFGWDPFLPATSYQSGEGPFTIVRPPGPMGHADYFANWLVIVVFFALALFRLETHARWRRVAVASMTLAAFAILLSGTRSALLGLSIGAVLYLAMTRPRIDVKTVALVCSMLVLLTGLFLSPAGAKLRARVHWSLDDARGGARLLLWRDSLPMAMRHPLLGMGLETFTARFPPFESPQLARAYPDFYHESPHNMFLDVLTSRGIPGVVAVLALCALAAGAARKNAPLAAGLAAALVCQQFMTLTIPTALYFHLLIAALIANAIKVRPPAKRTLPVVMWPVAAICALGFLLFGARLILADRAMAVAEQSASAGDVSAAANAYRAMQRWSPSRRGSDLRYSLAMTRLAQSTRNLQTSIAAAQQSSDASLLATTTAEDRQNAWYHLATLAALRNDPAGVETALRQAVAYAPNWFKPHWALSQLLELTGRHGEARAEAQIALDLDGGRDPEVASTTFKILSLP